MGVIILSSLNLVVETYGDFEFLYYINLIINSIFIFEMSVKIISLGFLFDENTYLRDNWSQLDFIIVMFGIVDMSIV